MPIPGSSLAGSFAAPASFRPSERELEEENEKFFILAGDPRNHELADADYQDFVNQQAKRLVDFENGASRRKVDGVFRPRPAVEHTEIIEGVGVGQANHPADVARTKDAITALGLGGFDRTMERSTEATPEFFKAIDTSQHRLGVGVDGVMRPGGETNTAMKGAMARKLGSDLTANLIPAASTVGATEGGVDSDTDGEPETQLARVPIPGEAEMLRGAFRSIFELWWKAAKQDARRNIEHMKRGQPFPSISIPFHGRSRPAPEAGAKTRRAERALQRIWQDTLTRGGRDGMIGLYPPTITLTPAERNRLAEIAPGIDGGTAESRQKLKRFFGQILEARKVNISKEEEEELREEEAILEEETRKEVREERKAKGEQPKTGKTDPHQNQENVEFHKRMQQRLKELRDRQRTNARKEFLNNRIRDHKNQVNKETHWKKGRN